jgi:hypothetical protein
LVCLSLLKTDWKGEHSGSVKSEDGMNIIIRQLFYRNVILKLSFYLEERRMEFRFLVSSSSEESEEAMPVGFILL